MILGYIALKDRRQQNAEKEIRARGTDIAAHIQQIANQNIGVRIMACTLFKAGKIKEGHVPIENMDQEDEEEKAIFLIRGAKNIKFVEMLLKENEVEFERK